MLTQQEAIERIKAGLLQLPPLAMKLHKPGLSPAKTQMADAVLEVVWQDKAYRFEAEYKSRSTPKEFQAALNQAAAYQHHAGLLPMILMPFLNDKQLLELSDRQLSGVDFSGNGVVVVPGQLLIFRSGSKNQFPASEAIQNIYRKNASIVPRAFLTTPIFESVNSIEASIQMYGGQEAAVALSTVSKALKVLEEDLIIVREKGAIRLVQPEKLLDKLAANFARPVIRRFFVGKSPYDLETLMRLLLDSSLKHQVWLTGTGIGSIGQYAVMARDNFLSVYCTDQYRLLTGVEFKETNRFPNLEIIETVDKTVYFDSRQRNSFTWASPIQTYLELMAGDQRSRDTADQVKEIILADVKRQLT